MITDEERREVVQTLRGLDESIDEWGESRPLEHDAMMLRVIRAVVSKGDIFQRLADFIDRPTCSMVECTVDHGSRSWGMRCTACGREFEHMKPGFGWRFCPNCGAEVIDEDSAN